MTRKHAKPGSSVLDAIAPYWKSLAPLGAAIVGLGAALLPFTDGGGEITKAEWSAFGAAITAAGVTWIAPKNKRKDDTRKRRRKGQAGRDAVKEARLRGAIGRLEERGESALYLLVCVLAVLAIVVLLARAL